MDIDDTGSDNLFEDDPQADADWLAGVGIGEIDCTECLAMFDRWSGKRVS